MDALAIVSSLLSIVTTLVGSLTFFAKKLAQRERLHGEKLAEQERQCGLDRQRLVEEWAAKCAIAIEEAQKRIDHLQESHRAELVRLHDAHHAELVRLGEDHRGDHRALIEKQHKLALAQQRALDAALERFNRQAEEPG